MKAVEMDYERYEAEVWFRASQYDCFISQTELEFEQLYLLTTSISATLYSAVIDIEGAFRGKLLTPEELVVSTIDCIKEIRCDKCGKLDWNTDPVSLDHTGHLVAWTGKQVCYDCSDKLYDAWIDEQAE